VASRAAAAAERTSAGPKAEPVPRLPCALGGYLVMLMEDMIERSALRCEETIEEADDPGDDDPRAPMAMQQRGTGGGAHESRSYWDAEEDDIILSMHAQLGPRWRTIRKQLPGRSIGSVRNRFQRIQWGRRAQEHGAVKNRCQRCGEIKRGHTCRALVDGPSAALAPAMAVATPPTTTRTGARAATPPSSAFAAAIATPNTVRSLAAPLATVTAAPTLATPGSVASWTVVQPLSEVGTIEVLAETSTVTRAGSTDGPHRRRIELELAARDAVAPGTAPPVRRVLREMDDEESDSDEEPGWLPGQAPTSAEAAQEALNAWLEEARDLFFVGRDRD
jgi:hypothetical protein